MLNRIKIKGLAMSVENPVEDTDISADPAMRPASLEEFIGQDHLREELKIYIHAALQRGEVLDHVFISGPPGLGKTTLAGIIAHEMGTRLRIVSGPTLKDAGDIAGVLTTLEKGDILFIDEVHRMPMKVGETLYTAVEDFRLDIVVGEIGRAQAVTIHLEPFTLVAATTRPGMLDQPMIDRFPIKLELQLYDVETMERVVSRLCDKLNVALTPDAIHVVAQRSRGTPRIAGARMKRLRDHAQHRKLDLVDAEQAVEILSRLGIDSEGLGEPERRYLSCLHGRYRGGPVGIKALSQALGQDIATLETAVEPFLIQQGFIDRSARGRILERTPLFLANAEA